MRLRSVCEFKVPGKAASRGSKRLVRNRHTGKTHLIDGKNSYRYMEDIRAAAREAMVWAPPATGPIVLYWQARFQRPKSHYRKGVLRSDAPQFYTQTPDCSKIVRGIEDALSGIAYSDDKQIIQYAEGHGKVWSEEEPCTIIRVWELVTAA